MLTKKFPTYTYTNVMHVASFLCMHTMDRECSNFSKMKQLCEHTPTRTICNCPATNIIIFRSFTIFATNSKLLPSLKLTLAPENGWLEGENSYWEGQIFRGYVRFREGIYQVLTYIMWVLVNSVVSRTLRILSNIHSLSRHMLQFETILCYSVQTIKFHCMIPKSLV